MRIVVPFVRISSGVSYDQFVKDEIATPDPISLSLDHFPRDYKNNPFAVNSLAALSSKFYTKIIMWSMRRKEEELKEVCTLALYND